MPLRVEHLLQRTRSPSSQCSSEPPIALLVLRVPGRKLHLELREAEGLQHALGKVDARGDLALDLLRRAEDVRVVLRKAAHAQQSVHRARALVAVDIPQLRIAHRQVAIALRRVLVDQDVARAVHRLQPVLGVVELHRRIHVLASRNPHGPQIFHSSRRMMCGV